MIAREEIEPEGMRRVAEELARRWSDQPLAFVRNFSNVVYRVGTEHSLRLTSEAHRTQQQIHSELGLLRWVGSRGVAASQAVACQRGELLHRVEHAGVRYCAVLFHGAKGRSLDVRADPPDSVLLEQIGHLVFGQEWGFESLSAEQETYFDLRRRLLSGPWIWPES